MLTGWTLASGVFLFPLDGAASKKKKGKKATTSAPKSASAGKSSKKSTRTRTPARSTQQHPAPGRYQELQQALADRGHYSGPVDGNWGPESTEALRRFQKENNLPDDGKLSAKSILALGLGPQRASQPAEKTEKLQP